MYGRRVDGAQAAVDRERPRPGIGALNRCEGTTWNASPARMYSRQRSTPDSYCSRVIEEVTGREGPGSPAAARSAASTMRPAAPAGRGAASFSRTPAMRSTARS